jgi:hypothetical protein
MLEAKQHPELVEVSNCARAESFNGVQDASPDSTNMLLYLCDNE